MTFDPEYRQELFVKACMVINKIVKTDRALSFYDIRDHDLMCEVTCPAENHRISSGELVREALDSFVKGESVIEFKSHNGLMYIRR